MKHSSAAGTHTLRTFLSLSIVSACQTLHPITPYQLVEHYRAMSSEANTLRRFTSPVHAEKGSWLLWVTLKWLPYFQGIVSILTVYKAPHWASMHGAMYPSKATSCFNTLNAALAWGVTRQGCIQPRSLGTIQLQLATKGVVH